MFTMSECNANRDKALSELSESHKEMMSNLKESHRKEITAKDLTIGRHLKTIDQLKADHRKGLETPPAKPDVPEKKAPVKPKAVKPRKAPAKKKPTRAKKK